MKKTKRIYFIGTLISLAFISLFYSTSCSSKDEYSEFEPENITNENTDDTIYIDVELPKITQGNYFNLSPKIKAVYESSKTTKSRANEETNTYEEPAVYNFYDEDREITGEAIISPTIENGWIYECSYEGSDESIIIQIEQSAENEFIAYDENGQYLRTFTYDEETNELWTIEEGGCRRKLNGQDKFLCGAGFTAAAFLVGEAFAVVTGGLSLALNMGFFIASYYVCG